MTPTTAPRGVIPPLVTPLRPDGAVDADGLAAVVRRVVDGGVHGLFVLGTTGEFASLGDGDRRRVIDVVMDAAGDRVPAYVQVTDTRPAESLALARHAADAGAAAVVVSAPFYLPLRQTELLGYVRAVLNGQPLPVVLYNIPQFTGTRYDVPTVQRLLADERVVGIKDSGGDPDYQRQLVALARAERPGFAVLCGKDRQLYEMVRGGAAGCVAGGANLLPPLLVSLYDAAVAGDDAAAEPLQVRLRQLGGLFGQATAAAGIHHLKAALRRTGVIACSRLCDPYGAADEPDVGPVLDALGLRASSRVSTRGDGAVAETHRGAVGFTGSA